MNPRPYILAECTWKTVQNMHYEVAILPWGATEAHNYHLPYATDNYQAEHIVEEAARLAWEQGVRVVVLPTIPFGVQTGQMDVKLCMNLMPSTQLIILKDLCESLVRAGIPKLVIFNGHGGNDFKQMVRELSVPFPQLFTCVLNWFKVEPTGNYFENKGDHADEMETSVMQYIQPNLVADLLEAGDGYARPFRFQGMKEGWVSAQRQWTTVTKDTGSGDPRKATAEKGRRYLEAVIKKVSSFFIELAKTSTERLYE